MFRVIAPRPQVQSHLITYFYRVLSCTYPRYYIKYRMCARRPFDMFVNFYFLFYFFILSSQLRIRRCVWNRNEKKLRVAIILIRFLRTMFRVITFFMPSICVQRKLRLHFGPQLCSRTRKDFV